MSKWNRFWKWYHGKSIYAILLIFIIQWIQVPHMLWALDLYLNIGWIAGISPILDWLLYGVDLIEIVSIVMITMTLYGYLKNRHDKNKT